MAEPKLVSKRQTTNQPSIRVSTPKSPSQRSIKHFNSQTNILKNGLTNSSRDYLANTLSNKSASNDGSYPKCSSTSGTPCVDTGGYEDKRAYSGSGMAGWKEAGLAGNTNNQLSAGAGVTADVFIFGVGASGEIALRNHSSAICLDLTGCGQLGLGLHAGAGITASVGSENIQPSQASATVGVFGNFFAVGGAVNGSNNSLSAGKGVVGIGAGASSGVQACGSVSVICFLINNPN